MTVAINDVDFTTHDIEVLCDAALQVSKIKSDELGRWSLNEAFSKSLLQQEVELILESGPSTEVTQLCHKLLDAFRMKSVKRRPVKRAVAKDQWADGHEQLSKLVDHYQPKIRQAISQLVDAKKSNAAGLRYKVDAAPLEDALKSLYQDGYFVGYKLAHDKVLKRAKTVDPKDFGQAVADFSWDSWQPGNDQAAQLLSNAGPGLTGLLDDAGVQIKGMTDTQLQEISDALSYAADQGNSVDEIASMLEELGLDPDRADLIATTELARAVAAGTEDSYQANGVGKFNWLPADDACPLCEDQAQNGPYEVGVDDMPPLHPRCRCATTADLDSISMPDEE